MTDTPPDPPLRDLLTNIVAGAMCAQEETAEAAGDESWWGWGTDQIADFLADAILSDPRIAVVALPDIEPESFEEGPLHAKLPHAEDRWPRVQKRADGRIALASINNPFRTNTEAADTAAAILAILRNTVNNRGDQS